MANLMRNGLCADRAALSGIRTADQSHEIIDHFVHGFGLSAELFRSAGAFFGVGRVLLRDLVHLGDGRVDLVDALCLLG